MSKLKRLLCMALTVLALMSCMVLPASAEGEAVPLTWEEYIAANNITDWNWNDAADAIEKVARHAVELYKQGDLENAYTYAKATYWGYYETTGFERNTIFRTFSVSRAPLCAASFVISSMGALCRQGRRAWSPSQRRDGSLPKRFTQSMRLKGRSLWTVECPLSRQSRRLPHIKNEHCRPVQSEYTHPFLPKRMDAPFYFFVLTETRNLL